MPSKSKAQANLMRAVAHNPAFAKKVGIPQSVGKDFSKADKGRKFGAGGNVKKEMKAAKIFAKAGEKKLAAHERREAMGKEEDTPAIAKKEMSVLKKAKAPKDVMEYEAGEHAEMGMKRGGKVKKMADGGYLNAREGMSGIGRAMRDRYMAQQAAGDMMRAPRLPDERYKKGGSVGGFRHVADGIASKGKTKGTMVKMASGGSVGSASRRADGIAQRGKTRGKMC